MWHATYWSRTLTVLLFFQFIGRSLTYKKLHCVISSAINLHIDWRFCCANTADLWRMKLVMWWFPVLPELWLFSRWRPLSTGKLLRIEPEAIDGKRSIQLRITTLHCRYIFLLFLSLCTATLLRPRHRLGRSRDRRASNSAFATN